ncbi:hypothetical protein EV363DRAFT_36431 [Boletus edulis]|nr:hypothetical protein EV363DRAFT_36431 [Boletus edulis]
MPLIDDDGRLYNPVSQSRLSDGLQGGLGRLDRDLPLKVILHPRDLTSLLMRRGPRLQTQVLVRTSAKCSAYLLSFQRGACIAQLLFVTYSLIVSSIGRHLEITAIFCKERSLHPPWVFCCSTYDKHHTLLPSRQPEKPERVTHNSTNSEFASFLRINNLGALPKKRKRKAPKFPQQSPGSVSRPSFTLSSNTVVSKLVEK